MSVEHIITRYTVQGDTQAVASLNKIAAAGQRAHASTHGGVIKAPAIGGGSAGGGGGLGAGIMEKFAMGGSAAMMAPVALGATAILGLGMAAKAAAQSVWSLATTYGAAENKLRASLRTLEGSSADGIMRQLNQLAAKPGITANEATQGYIQARNAGMGRELAMKMLEEVGNANAIGGGDAEKLSRALLAMNQIMLKGKLQQEEVLQLSEAGMPMGKVMKAAFGTADTEAIQKMGLTSEEAISRLVAAFGGLPRATDSAANKLENLGVSINKGLGVIGNGILESLAPSLQRLGDTIMAMVSSGELDALGKSIGDTFSQLFDALSSEKLKDMIYGVAGGIQTLIAVGQGFINLIEASPIFKILKAMGKNVQKEAEAGKAMDWATLNKLNKQALSPEKYAAWLARHPEGSDLWARDKKPGDALVDPSTPGASAPEALKTIDQVAEARRRSPGAVNLADMVTGGGDVGRFGVTQVELGRGGPAGKPAVIVQGGRELNEGVRMIVMSVIDQMQQGGQLAKA